MSQEKEYFGGLNIMDEYHERWYWRRVGAVAAAAVILGLIAEAVLYSGRANADPRFQAQNEGITITLYDDACELTDQVANLPLKATWEEKGKTFQGCYGPRPDAGVVVAYFDDKTVALIPFQVLKRLVGA